MRKWKKAKTKERDAPTGSWANPFETSNANSTASTGGSDKALTESAAMSQSLLPNETAPVAEPSGIPNASPKPSAIRQVDVVLGQIISVFMRSPRHKTYSLADLEWRVLPGILSGQYRVVQAQQSGVATPVGIALWASVSAAVDIRLSDLSTPLRLNPDEWRSGDIPWLVELVANTQVQQALVKHLGETVFKGQGIKMRVQDADGKTQVGTFKGAD
jgi:cytolysin-activating lysine-acyltransferase